MKDKLKEMNIKQSPWKSEAIGRKLDRLRAIQIEADTLERKALWDTHSSLIMDILDDMLTLLGKIDLSKLSGQTREAIQAFEEGIVEDVYVYCSSEGCVNIASGTLHIDLIRIKKRLEKEKLNEAKGELYGADEVLEDAKDLIIELSREYVQRETTNTLQYKLRL